MMQLSDWKVWGLLLSLCFQGWLALLAVECLMAKLMLVYTSLIVMWTGVIGVAVWLSIRIWRQLSYARDRK